MISFVVGVFRFWLNVLIEALYKAWLYLDATVHGLVFAVIVLSVFFVYLLVFHGWSGIWSKFWEKALEASVITVIACLAVLLAEIFAEPWSEVSWATLQMNDAQSKQRSAELRKFGDAATIAQQAKEIANLKSVQVRPARGSARNGGPAILCQNLAECPKEELVNRAKEVVASLEDIMEPYYAESRKWQTLLKPMNTQDPTYKEMATRMNLSLAAEASRVKGKYKHIEIDVLAIRDALRNRLGHHDQFEDSNYFWAGSTRGDPANVEGIIQNLNELSSKVLATR